MSITGMVPSIEPGAGVTEAGAAVSSAGAETGAAEVSEGVVSAEIEGALLSVSAEQPARRMQDRSSKKAF